MDNENINDRLLTADELVEFLHVSKATAYNLMHRGEIPSVRMGRLVRVRLGDLEKFIRANTRLNGKKKNG